MKRELNGKELQGYIKLRQQAQIRRLNVELKMTIVTVAGNKVNDFYTRVKQRYGEDIGVIVEIIQLNNHSALHDTITQLNEDDSVHGIIVQLPIEGLDDPQSVLNQISSNKDIDGLTDNTKYVPATARAIIWLLNGYNVQLDQGRQIVVVGQGKLVGRPLYGEFQASGFQVEAVDEFTENKEEIIKSADIVVSAVGSPGLITSELLKDGAVVVDAGTTSIKGQQVGDLAADVFNREDITATPAGGKGGVGPLTVAALFDNLIESQ